MPDKSSRPNIEVSVVSGFWVFDVLVHSVHCVHHVHVSGFRCFDAAARATALVARFVAVTRRYKAVSSLVIRCLFPIARRSPAPVTIVSPCYPPVFLLDPPLFSGLRSAPSLPNRTSVLVIRLFNNGPHLSDASRPTKKSGRSARRQLSSPIYRGHPVPCAEL